MSYSVNEGAPTTATSIVINGSGGNGYIEIASQSPLPSAGGAGILRLFPNTLGKLSWIDTSGYTVTLDTGNLTGDRILTLPDSEENLITPQSSDTLTNKTILSGGNNIVDATKIYGSQITGEAINGDVLAYNISVNEWQPLTLSAASPLAYNGGAFSITTGTTAGTVATGDDLRFSTPQIIRVKNSNPGAGEFTSISAALASITDNATNKRYLIDVGPGIYISSTITTKAYVTICGAGTGNTIIVPSSNSITSMVMVSNATVQDVAFSGQFGGSTDKAISINGATDVFIHNIVMQNFHTLLYINAASAITSGIIFECLGRGSFVRGFHIDGRAVSGTNDCTFAFANNVLQCGSPTTEAVRVEGPYTNITIATLQTSDAVNGCGIHIEDGAEVNLTNSQLSTSNNGIVVANVGAGPLIRGGGVTLFGNTTRDISIEHPATTGVISGIADKSKVFIDSSSSISLFFTDPITAGSVIVGDLFYGPVTGSEITEIGELITYTAPLGEYTSGGVVTAAELLDVNVGSGSCYLKQNNYPTQVLRKITWNDSIITLTASATHYVYADIDGLNFSLSLPDKYSTVLLARVRTTATEIEFVDTQIVDSQHWFQKYLDIQRNISGVMYQSGSQVTANGSRQLAIAAGSYYYLNSHFTPTGQASPASWYAYYHSSGVFTRSIQTVISNTQYDNLTNLTAISSGKYVKHVLYIVDHGSNEQYFLVYGQTQFDTLNDAETGDNPTPPAYFEQGVAPVAAIIVQEGQTTIQQILDIRPRIDSSAAGSVAAVTIHGDLLGLGNDDHMQYLLVNGTRAMSGNLNMGGFNIETIGTVDGITISAHASRHLPNGSDPITSAAPLTNLSSVTTNTVGTANSFARSDHTHAIDISGFNISSLTGTLGVAHGGTGLTTLTSGNFLTGNGTSAVVTTKVVPAGDVIGTTDIQILTNKTIIGGSSGNVIAASRILGVTVDITSPNANEILIASSAGAAAWGLVTDSSLSGVISVAHGGTGLATLTSGNFLTGNGTGNVVTTKAVPAGVVVGTSDTQTLSNKTIVGGSSGNDIAANKLLGVTVSITSPNANEILIASSTSAAAWGLVTDSSLSGAISVQHGGTGLTTLTSGNFLTGNGTGNVVTTKVVPAGTVVGTSDTQTLSNKIIVGGSSGNDITANKLLGVTVGITSPNANEILIASSTSAAAWGLITDSSLSGAVTVPHGGTGLTTLTSGNFLTGNGTGNVVTTKVVPAGDVIGTTDTQTITNKTLLSATNIIDATRLQTVNISTTSPTNGQLLTYNSTSTQWEPQSATSGTQASQRWTVKDVKTVGTNGGSITANTWTTRTLNTLTGSADTSVTLASNQMTFTAGTYFITAAAPSSGTGFHKIRLRNITGSTDLVYGTSAAATPDVCATTSNIAERITFAGTTVVEVQHYATITQTNTGLGIATGIANTNEIYTLVSIEKLN